ncbi:MAG: site-2 protease family protein [Alphaproteobacteria bacterium]|nr:site-2 protease family protein [Alphaproteobacteria bacterium]
MFGHSVSLFRIFGFEIRVDITWAFLAILIAVSLARGFFPATYEGWPTVTYWWMAAVGIVGVFMSIVLHELAHSVAARFMGLQMKGITLFLFGGVAEMGDEPKTAKTELVMAIAGPIMSLVLAGLLFATANVLRPEDGVTPLVAVIDYLGWLNMIVAIFNMVPAFPLDGGRVLRAFLWWLKGDKRSATLYASRGGELFGLLLIGLGIFAAISGAFGQGLWYVLIGMFVRWAARSSYQQLEVRRVMRDVTAQDLMLPRQDMVPPDISVAELVQHHVYQFQQPVFPVIDRDELIGTVGLDEIRVVPQENWPLATVRQIMRPVDETTIVAPDTSALDAMRQLQQAEVEALIVARDHHPLGVVSQSDILKLIGLRMDLETR